METATHTPIVAATRLERPREGRVLAGVAAGIANYAGLSVGLVRLGLVIGALLGGLGILVYLAGWILIPMEGSSRSAARRWRDDLETDGRRLMAVIVGIVGLIILVAALPATLIAALIVVVAAALLSPRRATYGAATTSTIESETKE